MPGRRWSYVAFNTNRVHLFTARQGFAIIGAHVEESRLAGENGVDIEFTTPHGAKCNLSLRSRQDVLDLITALNKAVGV